MRTTYCTALLLLACGDGTGDVPVGEPAIATIGAEGGTLSSSDGRLTLEFPPGALAESTEIEIQEIEWDGGRAWSLRPDGLVLLAPMVARFSLPESEIGSPTTEIVDGEDVNEIPIPHFGHWSRSADTVEENVDVAVEWREADAAVDYAMTVSHFSTVFYIDTAKGRFTNKATLGLGERGSFTAMTETRLVDVSLLHRCGETTASHRVRARRRVFDMEVLDTDVVGLSGVGSASTPDEAFAGSRRGFQCIRAGTDQVVIEATLVWDRTEGSPAGCYQIEGGETIRRTRVVECTDECPFPDPADLGTTPDGDPSLDLRCARTHLTSGNAPWVRVVFDGPWSPSYEYYSWFVRITLVGAAGPIGSYTREWHDGMETQTWEGAVTEEGTFSLGEPGGFYATFSGSLESQIVSATIESGILKTPAGTFVTDRIDVAAFGRTPLDP